ncbi:unnamed protein product, partial [Polarella glacialis]
GGEAPDAPEAEVAAPPEIFLFQGSTQWAADWAEQETATENVAAPEAPVAAAAEVVVLEVTEPEAPAAVAAEAEMP